MCTCSVHCPESPYHESAHCDRNRCDCHCHRPEVVDRRFEPERWATVARAVLGER